MVLRGDRDPLRAQVLDRVVGAAVAERELERLQPDRAREQLVAEADAEHRLAPDQLADRVDDVVERGGVAGAGDEEDPVGVARQQLLGGGRAGEQLERRAARGEVAHDRVLDAGVERGDARAVPLPRDTCAARRSSPRGRGRGRPCSARRRSARAPRTRASRPGRRRRASRPRRGCGGRARACRRRRCPGCRCRAASRASRARRPGASARLTAARMIAARAWMRSDSMPAALTP